MSKKLRETLRKRLLASQGADGGWAYRFGKSSFVQPSALSALALKGERGTKEALSKLRPFLEHCRTADGLYGTTPNDGQGGWMTSFALLALCALGARKEAKAAAQALLNWRDGYRGKITPTVIQAMKKSLGVDVRLEGWPWWGPTASWVEPTAFAAKAVLAAGYPPGHPRLTSVRAWLLERACRGGGWNCGNPFVLGKWLDPYALPTATALIALAGLGLSAKNEICAKGLAFLQRSDVPRDSIRSRAWSLMALRAFGIRNGQTRALREKLILAVQGKDGPVEEGPHALALVLLALREHGKGDPLVP